MTEKVEAVTASKEEATEVIVGLWSEVIKAVNKLLEADVKFGFSKIEASLNPKIEDIIHGLGVVEYALNSMMDNELLDHDETRLALNAKQCVHHIRILAAALKSGDEAEYKKAVDALNSQAQI